MECGVDCQFCLISSSFHSHSTTSIFQLKSHCGYLKHNKLSLIVLLELILSTITHLFATFLPISMAITHFSICYCHYLHPSVFQCASQSPHQSTIEASKNDVKVKERKFTITVSLYYIIYLSDFMILWINQNLTHSAGSRSHYRNGHPASPIQLFIRRNKIKFRFFRLVNKHTLTFSSYTLTRRQTTFSVTESSESLMIHYRIKAMVSQKIEERTKMPSLDLMFLMLLLICWPCFIACLHFPLCLFFFFFWYPPYT